MRGANAAAVNPTGVFDKFMEWFVKFVQHVVARQFVVGNLVEFLFDVGSKVIVNDLLEVVAQEIGNQFAGWCRYEFTPVGTGFL